MKLFLNRIDNYAINKIKIAIGWWLLLSFIACKKVPTPLFERISPEHSGVHFVNHVKNDEQFNIFSYRNFYNGGGVAIGDINGDGLPDLYLTANMGSNKLYLNKGNFQFEDITDKAGVGSEEYWSTGVSLVDINQDGLLDIYVCNAGYSKDMEAPRNQLYINNGDLTFTEMAAAYGLDDPGYTTHAAFFDYDGDGLLDCYILNNSFIPVNTLNYSNKRELRADDWPVRDFLKGGGDKLLRNTGEGFVDVSESAGIYGSLIGFGLGVTVGDINNDGWPDIYVSNDFFERDYLYLNLGDGTFDEVLTEYMQHISLSSMGADMADINNDGWADIFVTDMLPYDEYRLKTTTDFEKYDVYQLKQRQGFYHQFAHNTLQLNNWGQNFKEISFHAGVAATDWSWGALMFDADGDGLQDILVCNGIYHDVIDQDFIDFFANDVIQRMVFSGKKEAVDSIIQKMPSVPLQNFLFKNLGGAKFENMADQWGLKELTHSNGAAYGDLNGDGSPDLVINNVNQPVLIYQNKASSHHEYKYLTFQLEGDEKNKFAIGSKVIVHINGEKLVRELIPNRGFQSSVDLSLHIGLTGKSHPDSVQVIWHDRTYSVFFPDTLNKKYIIQYEKTERKPFTLTLKNDESVLFNEIPAPFEPHREDAHVDFDYERNILMKLSEEGPCMVSADINGNGMDDLIIGGARGHRTQVWLQQKDGSFLRTEAGELTGQPEFEDTAITAFDANGDGQIDIFIGSGGNFQLPDTREMQDRLYLNNGDGTFSLKTDAFPLNGMNTSVAIPFDFNDDGLIDLFVGSRSAPYQYGVPPRSYMYINDGSGNFKDATLDIAPVLSQAGMICDAIMTTLFDEEFPQLVVVGEWFAPIILSYNGTKWAPRQIDALKNLKGWWYSVAASDLTGNGKMDLILGNRGTNGYLGSKDDLPVRLFIHDFSENGTLDKIITRQVNGRDVPAIMKKDLTISLPGLKKETLTHHQFATRDVKELFGDDKVKKAFMKEVNFLESIVLLNDGNGIYKIVPLPLEAQLSSVYSIATTDIDEDGLPDLILGGNHYGYPPQFSRLDSNFGTALINKGEGQFSYSPTFKSGMYIRGQVRSILTMKIAEQNCLLFGINNDRFRWFKVSNNYQKRLQ
jgi:enediyne biosynthesis protein E4